MIHKYGRMAAFVAFVLVVYGANWALEEYGVIGLPLLGWEAPAGVFFAGLAFGVRDVLHELGGSRWVAVAIAVGAGLSWWLSDAVSIPGGVTSIAAASGIAFGVSELADLTVYAPLRRRRWVLAVAASNAVGAVIDSMLFLWLAFGSLDFVEGQVAGKVLMILPVLPVVWGVRRVVSGYGVGTQGA